MDKKAFLVTFSVTTRIIAEPEYAYDGNGNVVSEGLSNEDLREAWIQAKEAVAEGMWVDHYAESEIDEEQPYDPETDDFDFEVGDMVYWTDPGEDLASGVYQVVSRPSEASGEDTIYYIKNQFSEAEVTPNELRKINE